MNKLKKIMVIIFLFVLLGQIKVNAANYKVVNDFPSQLTNITTSGEKVWYNTAHGLIFQKWSDEAALCTTFRATRPAGTNAVCTRKDWTDEKIRVGVAAIIMSANMSNSAMSQEYYYADIAINYFLFQNNLDSNGNKNYLNQVTSDPVTQAELDLVLGTKGKAYYKAAEDAVLKYQKGLVVNKPVKTNGSNSWTIDADNINNISNTYKVTGTNMDTYDVKVKLTNASSGVKVWLKKTGDANFAETTTLTGLHSGDTFEVKVSNFSEEAEDFTVNITTTGKMSYYVAANYECKSGNTEYQNLTVNEVQTKTKSKSTATSFKVKKAAPTYPQLKVEKKDENQQLLSGAEITLYEKNGDNYDEVETFKDDEESNSSTIGTYTYDELTTGEYCLQETAAPEGYFLNSNKYCFVVTKNSTDVTITKSSSNSDKINDAIDITDNLVTVTIKDTPNEVKIWKVNEQGNYLAGAKLKLVRSDGESFKINGETYTEYTWTSGGTEADALKIIKGLPTGIYRVYELEVPDGFVKTDDYRKFTITDDMTHEIRVAFPNRPNSITISKIDIANSKELPGATLRILKEDGKTVATDTLNNKLEWVSTNEAHVVAKIPAGTYYLEETQAPTGYALMTEKIKFTVDEYGKVKVNNETNDDSVVIMSNAVTKVSISKQDITNKEELPGATLRLLTSDGILYEEWVSTNEPHLIEGLPVGTYKLVEITSPDGYTLNEETVIFTINADGSITGDTTMYNTPIPEVPSTASTHSLLFILIGILLVGSGLGLYIYGIKKKKKI